MQWIKVPILRTLASWSVILVISSELYAQTDVDTTLSTKVYDLSGIVDVPQSFPWFDTTPPVVMDLDGLTPQWTKLIPEIGGGGGGLGGGGPTEHLRPKEDLLGSFLKADKLNRLARQESTLTRTSISDIDEMVTTTVDPDSWSGEGGKGEIGSFRNFLIIRQTATNHAAIQSLIGALKDPAKDSLRVRVFWLLLPAMQTEDYHVGKVAPESLQTDLHEEHTFVTELICKSGQTVSLCGGDQATILTELTAVISAYMAEHDNQEERVQLGCVLEVTPKRYEDRVSLYLKGSYSEIGDDPQATANISTVMESASTSTNSLFRSPIDSMVDLGLEQPYVVHRTAYMSAEGRKELYELVLVVQVSVE